MEKPSPDRSGMCPTPRALRPGQDQHLRSTTPPRLADGRRLIRVFPEWGTELPLWESFTDHYLVERGMFPISDALLDALAEWNAQWQNRPEDARLAHEEHWLATGRSLVRQLRTELHGIAEIRAEFDR
jgi:hypothetical protein